jgi:hypothetical protein
MKYKVVLYRTEREEGKGSSQFLDPEEINLPSHEISLAVI